MNKVKFPIKGRKLCGKKKSEAGQTELLLSLGFLILASTFVFAYNATMMNITDNSSGIDSHGSYFTGNVIMTNATDVGANVVDKFDGNVINQTALIEVWANTKINLTVNLTAANETNSTINIQASLTMDNGSAISGQRLDFYLDNFYNGSFNTDEDGKVNFEIVVKNGTRHVIKVSYAGNESLYLNKSENEIEINLTTERLNETLNLTKGNETLKQNESGLEGLEIGYGNAVQISSVNVSSEGTYAVRFSKNVVIYNPNNESVYNKSLNMSNISNLINLPNDAFNIEPSSIFIEQINAGEHLNYTIKYSVPLVVEINEILGNENYRKIVKFACSVDVKNIYVNLDTPPIENVTLFLKGSDMEDYEEKNASEYRLNVTDKKLEFYIDKLKSGQNTFEIFGDLAIVSEVKLIQGKAEIGKPVKWYFELKFKEFPDISYTLPLPKDAYSVVVKYKGKIVSNNKRINLGELKRIGRLFVPFSEQELEKIRNQKPSPVFAEFYTPAPQKIEKIVHGRKRIIIYSSSELHYHNVTAYTNIDEGLVNPRLYRLVNGSRIDVTNDPLYNVTFKDKNGNKRVDYVEWNVPRLSTDIYEIEIDILNVQSYPTVGGNWTVRFNTKGMADLIIMPVFGTTFAEKDVDIVDNNSVDDLDFLELKKGNKVVKNYYYLVKPEDLDAGGLR